MKHDSAFYEDLALQAHDNSIQFDPYGAPAQWWLQASAKWATLAVAAATLEAASPRDRTVNDKPAPRPEENR